MLFLFLLLSINPARSQSCAINDTSYFIALPCDLEPDQQERKWPLTCDKTILEIGELVTPAIQARTRKTQTSDEPDGSLWQGFDVDIIPQSPIHRICKLDPHALTTCGIPYKLDTGRFGEITVLATENTHRENSIRNFLWVRALDFFKDELEVEMSNKNGFYISEKCRSIAEKIKKNLEEIEREELSYPYQKNFDSILDDKNPCINELEEYSVTNQYNQNAVTHRISGCRLKETYEKVKSLFSLLAVCEIRSRAYSADDWLFSPQSTCKRKPNSHSVFNQNLEKNFLQSICHKEAIEKCSLSSPNLLDFTNNRDYSTTSWECVSGQIKNCYEDSQNYIDFISKTILLKFPQNIALLEDTVGYSPSLGIVYHFKDSCKNCASNSTDLIEKSIANILDKDATLKENFETVKNFETDFYTKKFNLKRSGPPELPLGR